MYFYNYYKYLKDLSLKENNVDLNDEEEEDDKESDEEEDDKESDDEEEEETGEEEEEEEEEKEKFSTFNMNKSPLSLKPKKVLLSSSPSSKIAQKSNMEKDMLKSSKIVLPKVYNNTTSEMSKLNECNNQTTKSQSSMKNYENKKMLNNKNNRKISFFHTSKKYTS